MLRMAKKQAAIPASAERCRDCIHAVPYTEGHLSVSGGKPLLASCPHKEHMVLLSQERCKNFKEKEKRHENRSR